MKKQITITLVLLLSLNLKAQYTLDTEYFNTVLAFTGTTIILRELPKNGNIKFDGHFHRTEKYVTAGAGLIAFAVLNDQLDLINLQTDYNEWLRYGLMTSSIIFGAIGDARFDMGYKKNGHFYKALEVGMLVSVPLFTDTDKKDGWKVGVSYMGTRWFLFDYVYNSTRNLDLDYQGSTSYYDKVMKKAPGFIDIAKGIAFVVGFSYNF